MTLCVFVLPAFPVPWYSGQVVGSLRDLAPDQQPELNLSKWQNINRVRNQLPQWAASLLSYFSGEKLNNGIQAVLPAWICTYKDDINLQYFGVLYSSELAFLLLNQQPWVWLTVFQKFTSKLLRFIIGGGKRNTGQWLDNVDRTHLVLAS